MQMSLDAERSAFQKRVDEELSMLKVRSKSMEADGRRALENGRVELNSIEDSKRKLEAERAEFASYINASSRAADDTLNNLRAEELRLNTIRDELARERAAFEQRKFDAQKELRTAEEKRAEVSAIAGKDVVSSGPAVVSHLGQSEIPTNETSSGEKEKTIRWEMFFSGFLSSIASSRNKKN